MKEFILRVLEEQPGEISAMRCMAMVCVLSGCLISIIGIVLNKDLSQIAVLTGVHLSAGLGAKLGQKAFEQK